MVKHTQAICRRIVWVFDHFVGLALKGLRQMDIKKKLRNSYFTCIFAEAFQIIHLH